MLVKRNKEYKLILASASPRRQELLKALGLDFELVTNLDADESYPENMKAESIPLYLAEKKSLAFQKTLQEKEILITADTIVAQSGHILHKPESADDAFDILSRLAGNEHEVSTGVFLRSSEKTTGFVTTTRVKFGQLSNEEIYYYIDNYKPFDKAGAYGIQEWIGYVAVEEIHGSYFNVMGMPIHKLYRELEEFLK